ncbi:MAG TPA: lipid biosynthesis B12-binding/radical SAM protein, partial [Sumerlaeia bacterium]|nr:lipid biosynthesis B12-binding/radical SAM protein [Sumerlaeia bacterium]
MAEILLISCNVTEEPYPVYPLGVSAVAAAARRRGHQVAVWDLLVRGESSGELAKAAAADNPDVIGLSLRNIDNVDSIRLEFYADRYTEIVRDLREEVSCPIVLGGAGYSLFPSELLEALRADFGVVGEGERAFCDLVDALADGRSPERRIWTAPDLLNGEDFGVPEREEALASHYIREGGMLNVQTKRGCPHRCAYCTYPCLEGCAYRFRSPADVVDEVEMLRDRHGADYIAFSDSVFNDAEGRYLEVAEELVRREIAIPWMAFFRPQRFRREEVALLKLAGLASVEWGTDCSTDAVLDAMGKDFTWSEVEESNRLFAESGIPSAHFIMFGGPRETEDTVR